MATCNLYHDRRRIKKDGKYPVKIRVSFERETKMFQTIFSLTESDFVKVQTGTRLTQELLKIKLKLDVLLNKARGIIEELDYFDFDSFTIRFRETGDRNDIISLLRIKARNLENDNFASNARLYRQAATLLERFVTERKKTNKLPIRELTTDFLKAFQHWVLNKDYILENSKLKIVKTHSVTTLSMYLIRVKVITNALIRTGHLSASRNPFGKDKYVIPRSRISKRPLTHD